MSLQRLRAWIKKKRRGSTQSQDESGVVISKRLKELLQVKNPEPVETTSPESSNEDDQTQLNREKFGT
jgi:ABC-type lipoprotein release transport system permease subunit